jgi:AraC family transcriptional regulator
MKIPSPEIRTLLPKKLVGMKLTMSLMDNKTGEIWRGLMPRRAEIIKKVTPDFISMQVYPESYSFVTFDPSARFEKWAACEVSDFEQVPEGMAPYNLTGGLYAVFLYRGFASDAAPFFEAIFSDWLPNSMYELDKREHFEVLGSKYKNNHPDSEEEVWIPVRVK